ncbi:MAG: winged helix-turn-helix domain-containing protein [Bacillota bacterium]
MMNKPHWTFLTNHGRVLVYLAKHPQTTTRKIAQEVGVTERAIQKVIYDLEADGYIVRQKVGRNNSYTIHSEMPMRHRMEREHAVGILLLALGCNLQELAQKLQDHNNQDN